jgi:hypothetical protein
MIIRRHHTLIIAQALAYLLWSALAVGAVTRHAPEHNQHADHAAKHASVACQLMCSAVAFVPASDAPLPSSPLLITEAPAMLRAEPFTHLQLYALFSRPPPALLV